MFGGREGVLASALITFLCAGGGGGGTFSMEHMMTFRKMGSLPQNHHLKSTRVLF